MAGKQRGICDNVVRSRYCVSREVIKKDVGLGGGEQVI